MIGGLVEVMTNSGGLTVTVVETVAVLPSESVTSVQNVAVEANAGVVYEAEVSAGEPEQLVP
jgi:hypothetical protein